MSPTPTSRLDWPDYLAFSLTLALSCGLGVYHAIQDQRRKRNTLEDFVLAGRSMSVLPVTVSLFVSWLSALSFISDPVEVYNHGIMYWFMAIGYCSALPLVAHFYVPRYHAMKLHSVFEFLETRYNFNMRLVASILHGLYGGFYCGFVLYVPALCISQATGMHVWVAILIVGCVCIFYTTLGGMKAVLWADTVQSVVMLLGLLTLLIRGFVVVGGFGKVWDVATSTGRTYVNYQPNPFIRSTVWSYTIPAFVDIMICFTAIQPFVHRYGTLKTARQAQMAVYLNIPIFAIFVTLSTLMGLVMVTYFEGCDPLTAGRVEKSDQILPLIAVELLSFVPGLSGLFVASFFCASLSTLSSFLNSLSVTLLKDIVEPAYVKYRNQPMPHHLALRLCKLFCVLLGLVFMGVSLLYTAFRDISLFAMTKSLLGCLQGPLAAMFFLGLFVKRSNAKGILVGCLLSMAISAWLLLGSMLREKSPTEVNSTNCSLSISNSSEVTSAVVTSTESWNISVSDTGRLHSSLDPYNFSPMLFNTLGFVLTCITAVVASVISELLGKSDRNRQSTDIYMAEQENMLGNKVADGDTLYNNNAEHGGMPRNKQTEEEKILRNDKAEVEML